VRVDSLRAGVWVGPNTVFTESPAKESNVMLYANALDTHELIRATKTGQRAECPDIFCKCIMMSRCSNAPKNTNHWYGYHDGKCDSNYEPISEWHTNWQNTINNPNGGINIEVPIITTERYKRADLKPKHGIIIEFQKSAISYREVKERESHYKKMIWVLHKDRTWSHKTRISDGPYQEVLHIKTAWETTRNSKIPIFIDCENHLISDNLLSNTISKEDFISKFINSDRLNYLELELGYWNKIKHSFHYYNDIIPKIKRDIQAKKDREEEERMLRLRAECQRDLDIQNEIKERRRREEKYQLQLEKIRSEELLALEIAKIKQDEINLKTKIEQLRFKDPQRIDEFVSKYNQTILSKEEELATKHKQKTEDILSSTLDLYNWKQIVTPKGRHRVVYMKDNKVIKARVERITALEHQVTKFEKEGIPTFNTETEILKLKRELSNLSPKVKE